MPSPCDGKGSPMELETCGTSVIDEGPLDVILSNGVDPKLIPRTLRKAQFKNVPVINIGASIPKRRDSGMITADFAPDDRAQTEKIDDYMIRRIKRVPPASRRIVVLKSTGPGAKVRFDQLEKDIEGTGIRIVGEGEVDPKKPDEAKNTVTNLLEKHDNLKAVWVADGNSVEYAGKAVDKAFKDLSFPDRPLVVGFNADPKAAEAIRDDEADAVADVAYDASLWIALDRVGGEDRARRGAELGLRRRLSAGLHGHRARDQGQRAGQEEVPRAHGGPRHLLHREVEGRVRLAARARLIRRRRTRSIPTTARSTPRSQRRSGRGQWRDAEQVEVHA